jgi:hypothetical protein
MKEHPHAEVLRAIADGVPLSEFECRWFGIGPAPKWSFVGVNELTAWITTPDSWEIRRKPQYIMVNGFKVPKPLDVMPVERMNLFVPMVSDYMFMDTNTASDSSWAETMFKRGIVHATKEAAIAHAKAMLGIDPEYFK